jgi:hypothetical protein
MKKSLILALLISFTAPMAFAEQGTLLLRGEVLEVLSIDVVAEAGATTLDLSASPTNLKVATVEEGSNSKTGYKINMSSAGNGFLKNGTLDSLAYEINYGAFGFITPTTAGTDVKTQLVGGVYGVFTDVNIKYTGKPAVEMTEGIYEDTLTFTISAN